MSATLKLSGYKGVITLDGDLTLSHAEELKGTFIKALADADDISIVFSNVQDVDLSCLQLLCSLHRSAVRLKKSVVFSGSKPPAVRIASEAAGFAHLKGCKLDREDRCLWMVAGAHHE